MDVKDAHKKFKAIVAPMVVPYLRQPKEIWERNWDCLCYQSIETFEKMFPTDSARRKLIKSLQQDEVRLKAEQKQFDRIANQILPSPT